MISSECRNRSTSIFSPGFSHSCDRGGAHIWWKSGPVSAQSSNTYEIFLQGAHINQAERSHCIKSAAKATFEQAVVSRLISCAGCACSLTGVPATFAQLPAVQRQFWQPEKRRSFRALREGVGACLCCRYASGSGLLNRKTLQMSRVSPVCVCEREPEHAGCFVSRCHLSSWAHF